MLYTHGLKNALIPVVTIFGLQLGDLIAFATITETIFSWPGMGKLIFDSVMGNDFNLALVALLFATALTLTANQLLGNDSDVDGAWVGGSIRRA